MSSTTTATSSPIITRPRSRSFSSTPTFSSDLAKLRSSCAASDSNASAGCIVSNYEEAIRIASTFDVLTSQHSPLARKVKLESYEDWKVFIDSGAGVVATAETENQDDDDVVVSINLEKLLRHCFDIAYKMPPSPCNKVFKQLQPPSQDGRARSASVEGTLSIAEGSSGNGTATAVGAAASGRASPPSLQI